MPNAIVVLNPRSSNAISEGALTAALRPLCDAGWSIAVRCTTGPGAATVIATQAVRDRQDVVVAAGGDGTVNEVVQGLAGTDVAFSVLPLGMENVWAATLGLRDLAGAVAALTSGSVRAVDLGEARFGDRHRYFVLMAGIGFDAAVVRSIEPNFKRRLGRYAFVFNAVRTALVFRAFDVRLELPQGSLRRQCFQLVAANAHRYAANMRITPDARDDDGQLDLCLFEGNGLFRMVRHASRVLAGRHLTDPAVWYGRTDRVTIGADPAQPIQLDGELAGTTPVELSIARGALKVIMP